MEIDLFPEMTRIPQRVSLVSQTAAILREDIQGGVICGWLPSERQLCARLQVSRVTLRAALGQLRQEKLIGGGAGRNHEILLRNPGAASGRTSTLVVLLIPHPLEAMQRFELYWIDDLRRHLAEAGHRLEVHESRACYGARPQRAIELLAQRLQPAGWVLLQSTLPMQQWFSARAIPCVIAGSRHSGVELPFVDIDHRALCRHAAGLFLAKGHRHLAFINLNLGLAGDVESEEGFTEAARRTAEGTGEALISRHDSTPSDVCRRLDLLLGRPVRPTAFLVSKAHHALTVVGHLSRRGVRVPQEASLISRDDEPFLHHVVPGVARYAASPAAMARHISRLVLEMISSGTILAKCFQLMPKFVSGETLGSWSGSNTKGSS